MKGLLATFGLVLASTFAMPAQATVYTYTETLTAADVVNHTLPDGVSDFFGAFVSVPSYTLNPGDVLDVMAYLPTPLIGQSGFLGPVGFCSLCRANGGGVVIAEVLSHGSYGKPVAALVYNDGAIGSIIVNREPARRNIVSYTAIYITLTAAKGLSQSINTVAGRYSPEAGVPEPSTWAMLLLGVGAAGAAVRRRRREQATLAPASTAVR